LIVLVGGRVFQSSVRRLTDRRHATEEPRSRPRLSPKALDMNTSPAKSAGYRATAALTRGRPPADLRRVRV